jgi:FixJ family two-component response regulator
MLKSHLHGGEVAVRLKSMDPDVKILLITGYLDIARRVRDEWPPIGEVMEKPFRAQDLLDAIRRVTGSEER